jgi:hypothetical protein
MRQQKIVIKIWLIKPGSTIVEGKERRFHSFAFEVDTMKDVDEFYHAVSGAIDASGTEDAAIVKYGGLIFNARRFGHAEIYIR